MSPCWPRPQNTVIDPGSSFFCLSDRQMSWRIKAANQVAGLGEGFQRPLAQRVATAQDLNAGRWKLSELMTPARWGKPIMPARYA